VEGIRNHQTSLNNQGECDLWPACLTSQLEAEKAERRLPRLESITKCCSNAKEPALVARGDGQRNRDDVTKVETLIQAKERKQLQFADAIQQ
jgi:hypothetical protein